MDRREIAHEDRVMFLAELSFADYNPRSISKEQQAALRQSLTRFDQVEPIIVNRRQDGTYVIIGGHQRARAMKSLGWTQCLARVVQLDDIQEKTLNLALNKVSSSWDVTALDAALLDLSENHDYPMHELGFNDLDLEQAMVQDSNYVDPLDGKSAPESVGKQEQKPGKAQGIEVTFGEVTVKLPKEDYVDLLTELEKQSNPEEYLRELLLSLEES